MLSINHFSGGKAAKDYFSQHLSKGDYFAKDAELLQPKYEGRTAEMLGLAGKVVDQESFFSLVDNRHPIRGEQITERQKANRRAMTDFTFDVPKSVSLCALVDSRIEKAVSDSIDETMRDIEKAAQVRVRKKGQDADRTSCNLLWVKWPHETTRPLSDGTVDPHLHRHVTVLNISYDYQEQTFKAVQFGDVVRDKAYYQAAYHARLGKRLAELGYGVEREGNSFRLAGLETTLADKFSRRTAQIQAKANQLGIGDPEVLRELGRKTRNKKGNELATSELRKEWFSRMTPQELESLYKASSGQSTKSMTATEAMEWAIEHSFERKSVITEKALKAAALRQGVGSVIPNELLDVDRASLQLIKKTTNGVKYVTTKQVYKEELDMLAFAREGRGKFGKLGVCTDTCTGGLSDEQRAAAETILNSRDRVTVLIGSAGTGKTRLMQSTAAAIVASGNQISTFAPSAEASRGVLRSEGFANADTVESLLQSTEKQKQNAGRVLWVDEAGLMSTKDMNRLFEVAKKHNNRIILSGDTKQHRSVARGDGLRLLIKEAGLKPASLNQIRRQRDYEYREAVQDISQGNLESGIERLDKMGAVVDGEDRYERCASDYLEAVKERKTALVVTPTHREASRITELIRERMKEAGRIKGSEQTVPTLYGLNYTVAEKRSPQNFQDGMVVQFFQNVKGFKRGEKATVVNGRLTTTNGVRDIPFADAERFQVYRKASIQLAQGDTIRITQNGRVKSNRPEFRLNNGATYRVAGFTKDGDIGLMDGHVLPRDYAHIDYGYTSTSHASQGKTVDRVLISMSSDSLAAANKEQFYVSVSRGRDSVRLYTDDREALLDAVKKSGQRLSATELLQEKVVNLNQRRAYQGIKERLSQAIEQVRNYGARRA